MGDTDLVIGPGPVFMCSGQGSQRTGMGVDLLDIPSVAHVFACASEVFGRDMVQLVTGASAEGLDDTRNAQAALSTLSVAAARACEERGVVPSAALGFSLGQVSALAVTGMLTDEETFRLVAIRSELMGEATYGRPGAMTALLKADPDEVEELCALCRRGQVLQPANFNCPGQIVVSGDISAIERVEEAWVARHKRFSRLATSGAFHSPLMHEAAIELDAYLSRVTFSEPRIPLICNVDARPLDAAHAREHLSAHLTHPVLFQQSVELLKGAGASLFVELGPGGVLSGLVRRVDRGLRCMAVQDKESLAVLAGVGQGTDPCPTPPPSQSGRP